ncbi:MULTISPECIES: PQQ-dependent sugar dehydrogenase [Methylosinus]|uniref:Sorbosone dehydrogenase n=1 Tax=Methylosinus trichosporium (strain ATCC 35070 / NCIMB 11131 / UNIQEM 75 / OB3b) TaxID=595536 RepID=A0A2D2D5Y7_METT3|nr:MULTISPECIES: PQQ-dependent sugar dehydrogenase [Methylosinus]ATQ70386.1 sorbosone dehydrogenase [Methylosinus trichosporium OB3b]
MNQAFCKLVAILALALLALSAQGRAEPLRRAAEIEATLRRIRLPDGFSISLYALVPHARSLAVAPGGEAIFVGTDERRIFALTPGGARAAAVESFAPGADFVMPHGLCFDKDGTLYVVEQNRVSSFAQAAVDRGRLRAADARVLVAKGALIPVSEQSAIHSTRMCRIGPDEKLYISLGQPHNVAPRDKLALYDRIGMGGIIRMNRDGSSREVFARGIRNSVGMDFDPSDGVLWFTDNQVDRMGDDTPPGEIDRAPRAGLHFGFPWYGGGHVRTQEYAHETPPADVVFPEVEEAPHAADLGMIFYTGAMFPERYRGGIFSAQHGSWDRAMPVGARVMFTPVGADRKASASEPFAEGWNTTDPHYLGRPVDVAQLPDGSLLVTDDQNEAVYRISYGGR